MMWWAYGFALVAALATAVPILWVMGMLHESEDYETEDDK